jgi:hypothetical protein
MSLTAVCVLPQPALKAALPHSPRADLPPLEHSKTPLLGSTPSLRGSGVTAAAAAAAAAAGGGAGAGAAAPGNATQPKSAREPVGGALGAQASTMSLAQYSQYPMQYTGSTASFTGPYLPPPGYTGPQGTGFGAPLFLNKSYDSQAFLGAEESSGRVKPTAAQLLGPAANLAYVK